MPDNELPWRTLRTACALVTIFTIVFLVRAETTVAAGLILGGALGLFSLWSLLVAVPRLLRSDKPGAPLLLGVLLVAKLPVYGLSLYYAMASPLFSPIATLAGAAAVPVVLTLKVIGAQMTGASTGDDACRT